MERRAHHFPTPRAAASDTAANSRAQPQPARGGLRRRTFVQGLAGLAAGAVAAGAVTSANSGRIASAASGLRELIPSFSTIWVHANRFSEYKSDADYRDRLVAFDLNGQQIAEINPLRNIPWYTADRTQFYVIWLRRDAALPTAVIEQYDAATGRLIRTITGNNIGRPRSAANLSIEVDSVTPVFSTAPPRLYLLHTQSRVKPDTERQAVKYVPNERTPDPTDVEPFPFIAAETQRFCTLEIIDLETGSSIAVQEVEIAEQASYHELCVAPNGQLYVSYTTPDDQTTVVRLHVTASGIAEQSRITGDGQRVRSLGTTGPDGSWRSRFLHDGTQMVQYLPNRWIGYFDLPTMTLARLIDIGEPPSARPTHPTSFFSPDSTTLYIFYPQSNQLRIVDVASGTVERVVTLVPKIPSEEATRYSSQIWFSPDRSHLYLFNPGALGATVIDFATFQPLGQILTNHNLITFSPTRDPNFFLQSPIATPNTLLLLDSVGRTIMSTQLDTPIMHFAGTY